MCSSSATVEESTIADELNLNPARASGISVMCDCVSPSSRLLHRELLGRSIYRRSSIVAEFGISLVRVGQPSFFSFRGSRARRVIRAENYAPLREDEDRKFDVLQLKRELEKEETGEEITDGGVEEKKLVPLEDEGSAKDDVEDRQLRSRRGRQMLRRSSLLAKQVISIRSARNLGFVSQLWIDSISWTVMAVEVRPHLLSGEIERILLEDLYQVGDVVLVQDESIMENEIKLNGLDSLVGYNVVTPTRRKIGKVRGFSFDINSGAVESLELDSLGMSLIPASLVSTYSLMVEDVVQVVADTVVVDPDAESRLQRLTKGLLDNSNIEARGLWDDDEDLIDRAGRSNRRRRSRPEDYWDLPVDF
ncbi:uncharacterized protein LOC144706892 isoform X1 [Wolffia australiana]